MTSLSKPRVLPLLALFLLLFLKPLPIPRLDVNKTQKIVYNSNCPTVFEKFIAGGGETIDRQLSDGGSCRGN